ncbi:peptidoglycan-associated lipoprotein Pal [Thiomicrorhabdus sp. 6S2-11]|uniref:Peptidoglycan-associated lipoprotein n=1 Tax=Thiomicrorhabdus marina TaxID=2818442 RepID=A0ABS3Q7R1_9GAMM|nr:peptidoglycan-associated lipoprotein Pal [Thiomicrorhabdus marina]MBO1928351.1 peptidoglycan-associated lipoprotein Pal [Thiomicrorhabdus marina]
MVKNFAKLFAVTALGMTLVGCSSTPEVDDSYKYEEKKQSAGETSQGSANLSMTNNASDLDANKAPAEMTNEQLKAMLRGKVVYFDYDRSDVRAEYYQTIKLNAKYLNNNPSAQVTIAGHCDERGSREYNLALGERRALSVKNALMVEGISADRINVVSFGEDMPVVDGHTESAWSKNRRAEFNY